MNAFIKQFVEVFRAMPLARKVMIFCVLALVVSGFALMFFWVNQVDYQTLFTNLSQEDASSIVSKLKEQNIPYKIKAEGTLIQVPAENVYEMRLALASEGLPKGDSVGFEVFDNTTFSTTEFVQKLNYQRALQGELARTISQFEEVDHARVMLVMPEESLFIEDEKPPSASVLLKLRSNLSTDKVAGVVHLVASSVEGLEARNVTVVDTRGKVLYKPDNDDEQAFAKMQTNYQRKYEQRMAQHIQTLLEGIIGEEKAIVRVNATIDFDQIDVNEEIFDPDAAAIRSEQLKSERSQKSIDKPEGTSEVESGTTELKAGRGNITQKSDKIVNYEITKVQKRTSKPFGSLKRLSVAAVVDWKAIPQFDDKGNPLENDDGSRNFKYEERSTLEMQELEEIVKKAMGYNADREDQIKVSCMRFNVKDEETFEGERNWLVYGRPYIKPILNLLLVLLIFFFVVRPFLKAFREMAKAPTKIEEEKTLELPEPEDEAEKEEDDGLPDIAKMSLKDRVIMIANNYPEKTENWVRGWINEVGSDSAKS